MAKNTRRRNLRKNRKTKKQRGGAEAVVERLTKAEKKLRKAASKGDVTKINKLF